VRANSSVSPSIPALERMEWLRLMYEIRASEEEIQHLFTQGLVRGSTHLCQGQEAVSVGACRALEPGDTMTCTYRGHGAVIAMGAPLDRTFGEILGRAEGLCGGKGGSMHLTDVSVGALGSFAIVGAHLPIACGTAFAARYTGSGAASLCFFGDGAVNIGAFHEALNLASIWKLPAIFVCENNLYGEYSPVAATTPIRNIADRADAYEMAKAQIDGNDVELVYATVREAAARARAGEGPTFIEALTYRHKGHSRSDPAKYRPEGELEAWLERDPIHLFEQKLVADGADPDELAAVKERAEQEVIAALERAMAWPPPDPERRFDDVVSAR
jgi:acetoin:2,6-dichlorophenolindophenol oxidoreductase subunit alpha